jgi:hypothetical protein
MSILFNPMAPWQAMCTSKLYDREVPPERRVPAPEMNHVTSMNVDVPGNIASLTTNYLSFDDPNRAFDAAIDRVGDQIQGMAMASFTGGAGAKWLLQSHIELLEARREYLRRRHPGRFGV